MERQTRCPYIARDSLRCTPCSAPGAKPTDEQIQACAQRVSGNLMAKDGGNSVASQPGHANYKSDRPEPYRIQESQAPDDPEDLEDSEET